MGKLLVGLGVWILADGVSSLWTYTDPNRGHTDGQTWLRDHSLRIFRCLIGIVIVIVGVVVD